MATRIKKYAQQTGSTSAQVLGLLHAIGYTRYRSPQDMLPDAAIMRLERAVRDGVKADPVDIDEPAPVERPVAAAAPSFMEQVLGGGAASAQPSVRAKAPLAAPHPSPPPAPPAVASAALTAEVEALGSARAALEQVQQGLSAEREHVTQVKRELELERERLLADRARLDADILAHQALVARFHAERVERERAELETRVKDLTRAFGARCLLEGLRRVTIVGGQAADLKVLRAGLDPRVELRYAAGERGAAEAGEDSEWGELVLVWGSAVTEVALGVYSARRTRLVALPASPLGAFLADVVRALSESDSSMAAR